SEERVSFTVTPSPGASGGVYTVAADLGDRIVRTGTTLIRYPHIPAQTIFPSASGKLVVADVRKKKFTVGYIDGSGDEVPEALRRIGYEVRLLTDEDLLSADLAHLQAIVAGVRAYNTRPALGMAQRRLMEYVSGGGTYIVQYATNGRMETGEPGPYPLKISRDRVSDETAPVTLLAPGHPALTYPNTIGPGDFSGWVQELGLYFADSWDSAYVPLISAGDPGEPARRGGLLVARHGNGYFCYTGLSFFRQLPAGVPGAYRLFANLIELGSRERVKGQE
ncbi:MAG TPA: LmbE family protein, partial [Bacteroidota bacterium]|nr:LmbE family protein [Bacteroidota bacterium]